MATYNKYYETWFRGTNIVPQGSGYADNVSLRNDGRTELRGDSYITNSGRLMINKDKNSITTYYLDVSGNSSFAGDIVIPTKNTLSKIKTITTSTTLSFGDPEYISISPNCTNNSTITLPSITNTNTQLGTKFTFFYADATTYPDITIASSSGQFITDNIESLVTGTFILSYFRTFVEMVCVSNNMWAISNGTYDYTFLPFTDQNNDFIGINTFPTQLTTDNSQRVATTQYVKSNLSSYQTTSGMSSYALLASPAFTGNPTTTTQLTTDNSTRIASTAYVKSNLSNYQTTSGMSLYALLDSPTFTGTPHAPTTSSTANSTRIATTAFVKSLNYASTSYADGLITALLDSINYWTNENHFDDILPQSILEPTSITDFVVKGYVDNNFLSQATANSDFLSIAQANSDFLSLSNANLYWLTISSANSTFQPISAMGGYLLTATANSTFAPINDANLTGSPTAPTPITTTNSTRIATCAYVKSNLNSYLLTADATSTYQPLSSMSNYVLQSYLDSNYNTTSYINNNYANLNTTNTLTGALNLEGAVAVKGNISVLNGKTLSITSGCFMNYASGSTVTGTMNVTGIATFPAPNQSNSFSLGGGLRNNATAGTNNMAIGNCLVNNTTSPTNMAIGNGVLNSNVSSVGQHLGIGHRALEALTTGEVNNAIGYLSGYTLQSGSWNSFFSTASGAGILSNSNHNFCMGFQTMASWNNPDSGGATNVNRNLALGSQAMTIISSNISDNVAIGFNALGNQFATLNGRLQGSRNVAIGSYAGYGLDGTGCNDNVFIGYNTGVANGTTPAINTTTLTNITAINTGVLGTPTSNRVYIGNSAVTLNVLYGTLSIPNISFTGTLNSISTTVFSYISGLTSSAQTQISNIINGTTTLTGTTKITTLQVLNKQTLCSPVLTGGSASYTFPMAEMYYISVSGPQTITLPAITTTSVGVKVIFRRAPSTGSTIVITFNVSGGTQLIYNLSNTGANSVALLASGVFSVTLCAGFLTASTYAWYVI